MSKVGRTLPGSWSGEFGNIIHFLLLVEALHISMTKSIARCELSEEYREACNEFRVQSGEYFDQVLWDLKPNELSCGRTLLKGGCWLPRRSNICHTKAY